MTNELALGDLEFKAADFSDVFDCDCHPLNWPDHSEDCYLTSMANHVNQTLRGKLANAPEVSGFLKTTNGYGHWQDAWDYYDEPTHSARLVCVKELKP